MPRKYSIADARKNLPGLVRQAENGRTVELSRRGVAVAVLIGQRHYERLILKRQGFSETYEKFVSAHNLGRLVIDPDEVFGSTRDAVPGREVDL
jgi:prevent-host-death family protein